MGCCILFVYLLSCLLGVLFVTLSGGVLDQIVCANFTKVVILQSKNTYRDLGWFLILCVAVSIGRCLAVRVLYVKTSIASDLLSKTFRDRGRPKRKHERYKKQKRNASVRTVKSLTWIVLALVCAVIACYHTVAFNVLFRDKLAFYNQSLSCWYIPITFGVLTFFNVFGVICLLIMICMCLLKYGSTSRGHDEEESYRAEDQKKLINEEEEDEEVEEDVRISQDRLPRNDKDDKNEEHVA